MKTNIRILSALLTACMLAVCLTACKSDDPPSDKQEIAKESYEWFCEISKIPRGSGNMQAISKYLKSFGEARGLVTIQDATLNILIKKPGTKGRKNEPPIILQAHMDMVCQKNEGVEHDFTKDPIIPVIRDGWVYPSSGTSLGADNGSGLGMIMAVLDSKKLSHPPIEALITTDEETTMDGAALFNTSLLSGKQLINLDSERDGILTVSSAGGVVAGLTIPIDTVAVPAGFDTYRLIVKGLKGGHSGLDIDKGHANANILLARLLDGLEDVAVSSIDGGTADNAIPRECAAVISLRDLSQVQSVILQMEAAFKLEFPLDTNLSVTLETTSPAATAMNSASLGRVLKGILQMPNGVISMSPSITGLVQTSNNLGIVATQGGSVELLCFVRSSSPAEMEETKNEIQLLGDSIGAAVDLEDIAPPWPHKVDSPLRDRMVEIYKELFGKPPSVEAIHAGLECAWFALKMPDCDIISIGPETPSVHSPDEKMQLSSFNKTVEFLVEILNQANTKTQTKSAPAILPSTAKSHSGL
jgi:dipeptidase D